MIYAQIVGLSPNYPQIRDSSLLKICLATDTIKGGCLTLPT